MSDRPWWAHLLQWGLWALVMALVMGWLAKSRRKATVATGAQVLTHPPTTLIVGLACTVLFMFLTALAALYAKDTEGWTPLVFLGFALLGAPLVGEALRVRHEVRDDGIVYRGLFATHDKIAWDELESVRWSVPMKWLAVKTRDGRTLRFSGLLNGLDALARALHERAPAMRVDESTAKVLADAREGKLPSIWA
jgi:Bacterial PH domain